MDDRDGFLMGGDEPIEDIDALNDETFGCDVADINDDWEEEHEKFVDQTEGSEMQDKETSLEFFEITRLSTRPHKAQHTSSTGSYREHFLISSSTNDKHQHRLNIDEIMFPNCEDIITKSVLDVVSDEIDFPDIYSSSGYSPNYENDLQNGMFQNEKSLKEKAKHIDLDSLRPPSPSILPLDHTFMSNVWRPPSPTETAIAFQHTNITSTNNNSNFSTINNHRHSPKDSPKHIPTASDIFETPNIMTPTKFSSPITTKFIRAEDLEADFNQEINKSSTPNTSNANNSNRSLTPSLQTPFNMVANLLNLSTTLCQSSMTNKSPSIPSSLSSKVVQPPPGFGTPNNNNSNNKNKIPSMIDMNKIQMQANQMVQNDKTRQPQPMTPMQRFCPPGNLQMLNMLCNKMPPPPFMMSPFHSGANILNPAQQMQQQRIINKIITPAQAQRSYDHHINNFFHRNQDKFAGFMVQKEKEWLIKIFRLQCKVNDPYVEDYYEVNYMLKKNYLKKLTKQKEIATMNESSPDGNTNNKDSDLDGEPMLVLPQLAQQEEYKPKYIQFDNALGKIQVLNSKCPRKLVEFNENEVKFDNYKLDSRSRLLLKIERLYELFLNIEDEDKRMPILPDDAKQEHREKRTQLCKDLFNGLTLPIANVKKDESQHFILINRVMLTLKRMAHKVDPNVLKINKGLVLVIRSLLQLEDEYHIIVLASGLLTGETFGLITKLNDSGDNSSLNHQLANAILKAISKVKSANALIYIVSNIDDSSIFINNKYGPRLLLGLFKQYELSDDKLLFIYFWNLFVQTLIKQIPETEESYNICQEHLKYLSQL